MQIEYRLARLSDAPELKKLNDLFNGDGCNTQEAIVESLGHNEILLDKDINSD